MKTTIRLSNGRVFNLLEDDFTSQGYRELSGVEIRYVRGLQEVLIAEKSYDEFIKIYEETGLLIGIL